MHILNIAVASLSGKSCLHESCGMFVLNTFPELQTKSEHLS